MRKFVDVLRAIESEGSIVGAAKALDCKRFEVRNALEQLHYMLGHQVVFLVPGGNRKYSRNAVLTPLGAAIVDGIDKMEAPE